MENNRFIDTSELVDNNDLARCCQLRNCCSADSKLLTAAGQPAAPAPLLATGLQPFPAQPHQALATYYTSYTSDVHDLNLTNLHIWARRHDLHYIVFGDYLFYVYYPREVDELTFSEAVGDYSNTAALSEAIKALADWLKASASTPIPLRFRRVSSAFSSAVLGLFPHAQTEAMPDTFDYCYLTQDLATLSGNRYHKKKNHLNQFQKKHEGRYRIAAIDSENAKDALVAATNWCRENGCKGDYDLCFEYRGIHQLLSSWEEAVTFGLEGVVVYVDEAPVGITLAEPWVNDTLLVHIEKGDTQIPGIYAAINHAMANQALGRFKYLNREQDMGIEGIRKAKQSYLPSHLVEKTNLIIL